MPNPHRTIAWAPSAELDLRGWLEQGARLGMVGRGIAWWIGDWMNYGNARYGEKYTRAAKITGYDVQSLMNMAYVASRLESCRRREALSWSHHAEVAALPHEQQEMWLDRAERDRLSVRCLRNELRSSRRTQRALERRQDHVVSGESVCPSCGHTVHATRTPAPAGRA